MLVKCCISYPDICLSGLAKKFEQTHGQIETFEILAQLMFRMKPLPPVTEIALGWLSNLKTSTRKKKVNLATISP